MNLIDLPDLMRQRSDEPTPTLTESRLEGVHHKVVIARRRRVAGSLVAVAAVVVAALGVGLPLTHNVAKVPAAEQTIDGFPAYAEGGHVVGTANGDLHGGPLTVKIVPERLDFIFTTRCSTPDADPNTSVYINIKVDGQDLGGFTCSAAYASFDPGVWPTLGLVVGKAATFTFTATRANGLSQTGNGIGVTVPVPAGSISVAVMQKVPFDQYPLPPRPEKLPSPDVLQDGELDTSTPEIINSDPTDPSKPISYTFTFPDCGQASPGMCLEAAVASQTPGFLVISINGTRFATGEFWDYSGGEYSFELDPTMDKISPHVGERVTVTITPQYVTGAWQFGISTKPIPK